MLLRCLDSGRYALGDERDATPLSAAEAAARLRGKFSAQALAQDLHLLLPAARCLATAVAVAKHEARHLDRTLPWILEERLLEPAEHVHVAHGPVENGSAAVAAVNAAWLRRVLDELRTEGLEPQCASSELFLLPWQAGQWTVFLPAAGPACVRHGAYAGFACARANLPAALQSLLNEHDEPPRAVAVIADSAAPPDSALFPVLLQARLAPQRNTLAQLAHAAAPPAVNFLQGRFAPALPWARWVRQWRVAAVLLLGLFATDLALSAYESARLNAQAEARETQILALYRSVQPEGAVVDARLQLEQALAAAGAAGGDSFLSLLGRMAPALQAVPEARVQNLEYDSTSGALQVQVFTGDYAAAENLRMKLQEVGLQAELMGSNRESNGNRTRLRVGSGA